MDALRRDLKQRRPKLQRAVVQQGRVRRAVFQFQRDCTRSAADGALCIASPLQAEIPRVLMQYWDRDPPLDISLCLLYNKYKCSKMGFDWVLFDDAGALEYMNRQHVDDDILALYREMEHPAMKSDLFRLMYLYHSGGFYLDADLILGKPLPDGLNGVTALFQLIARGIPRGLMNSFMFSYPKSPILKAVIEHVVKKLGSEDRNLDGKIGVNRIILVTGPQAIAQAVGRLILDESFDEKAHGLSILTTRLHHPYILRAETLLEAPLEYKKSEKNWHFRPETSPATASDD